MQRAASHHTLRDVLLHALQLTLLMSLLQTVLELFESVIVGNAYAIVPSLSCLRCVEGGSSWRAFSLLDDVPECRWRRSAGSSHAKFRGPDVMRLARSVAALGFLDLPNVLLRGFVAAGRD